MPYITKAALQRIAALEKQVADERALRDTQGQEHARQLLHCVNMLLRRGETYPIPAPKEQPTSEPQPIHRPLSDTVLSKYAAIRQEAAMRGRTLNDADVVQWVKDETGYTPSQIDERMQALLSSELEQ